MGLILFIVAIVLMFLVYPIGYAFMWFKALFTWNLKELNTFHLKLAIEIDELGNLMFKDLFNITLKTKDGYKFGNDEETVSSCLGKNKQLGTLTWLGYYLALLLNRVDKNHVEKSIKKF